MSGTKDELEKKKQSQPSLSLEAFGKGKQIKQVIISSPTTGELSSKLRDIQMMR